ncbi:MAG TPA: nuclear transport factor 2 family protein [Gemmatimonadales bacterium]|nr:nuclear transport factor 2 family protein [Gemmatimonadales bacterium]
MTSRGRVVAIAVLLVLCAGAAAAQGPSALEQDIRTLLDESAASWNRGDLDGHLADNADSITFMTRNGPIVGKSRTADALRRSFFRDGKPIQQLRFEQVTIRPLGTDHALVVGRFVLEGGGQPEQSGWFSTVWERQAAGWRVIHDHSS